MPRRLTDSERDDLIEIVEMTLNPLAAELAEKYDVSVCKMLEIMNRSLVLIHQNQMHRHTSPGDPRWN